MKKRINLLAALILGLSFGPAAAADQRVPGESLDNGLGNLAASYTAAEYNRPGWVPGESIDTGLGELAFTYTAAEYNKPGWVRGESLDSGLGELPPTYNAAEYMPDLRVATRAVAR
jgi:hypothetical protein